MSYSDELKQKMCRTSAAELNEKCSELYAFTLSSSSISLKGRGRLALKYTLKLSAAARRVFSLIKDVFGFSPQVSMTEINSFGEKNLYIVSVDDSERVTEILRFFCLMDEHGTLLQRQEADQGFIGSNEEFSAFMRAMFISCGYARDPIKEYLISFSFTKAPLAQSFAELLNNYDIKAKIRTKNNDIIVYVKSAEDAGNIMGLCGDYSHMLSVENALILKQMKATAARVSNCDVANTNKTVRASAAQVKAIEKLIRQDKFSSLSEELIATANLRLENPEASINELCELWGGNISRSTLSNRLKRLTELSEALN